MDFTELRLKKISESSVGTVYAGLAYNFYEVKQNPLSKDEGRFAIFLERLIQRKAPFSDLKSFKEIPSSFADDFREEVVSIVEINGLLERIPPKKVFVDLIEAMIRIISKISFISDKSLFAETVLHNSVGLKQLSFFSLDDSLEELMINALDDVFVFHRELGVCKTDLVLDEKIFENIIQRVAFSVGKKFNANEPLLDARLPDGSRVNATFSEVSPKGSSLTIRKFSPIPLTVLDLIENNTISSEAAAFLWVMVEGFGLNPKNVLIVGGTASGKTTFLNILSNFIRFNERIITIEDTLEVSLLDRKNWVALEAKHSIENEVTMDSLLKNSLRMRPDRIVVGEVRGSEALTLFTAMDNGHSGCLGTIHANNARETIIKLQEKPFSVPESMLPLVDLIVVMQRIYSKENGMQRRVVEITELSRMDKKVLLANVFDFDESSGALKRTDLPSHVIEEFAQQNSLSKNEVKKEIETRRLILKWLIEKNVRKPLEVLEFLQSYYYDPKKVLSMIYGSE